MVELPESSCPHQSPLTPPDTETDRSKAKARHVWNSPDSYRMGPTAHTLRSIRPKAEHPNPIPLFLIAPPLTPPPRRQRRWRRRRRVRCSAASQNWPEAASAPTTACSHPPPRPPPTSRGLRSRRRRPRPCA